MFRYSWLISLLMAMVSASIIFLALPAFGQETTTPEADTAIQADDATTVDDVVIQTESTIPAADVIPQADGVTSVADEAIQADDIIPVTDIVTQADDAISATDTSVADNAVIQDINAFAGYRHKLDVHLSGGSLFAEVEYDTIGQQTLKTKEAYRVGYATVDYSRLFASGLELGLGLKLRYHQGIQAYTGTTNPEKGFDFGGSFKLGAALDLEEKGNTLLISSGLILAYNSTKEKLPYGLTIPTYSIAGYLNTSFTSFYADIVLEFGSPIKYSIPSVSGSSTTAKSLWQFSFMAKYGNDGIELSENLDLILEWRSTVRLVMKNILPKSSADKEENKEHSGVALVQGLGVGIGSSVGEHRWSIVLNFDSAFYSIKAPIVEIGNEKVAIKAAPTYKITLDMNYKLSL